MDLSQYEDAATLNRWFQKNFPMGGLRIIDKYHELIMGNNGIVVDEVCIVTTAVYRDAQDLQPATMNIARGLQSEYPKHMRKFFAEDVTTSSYARALALLKATEKTATKEGMARASSWEVEPTPALEAELQTAVKPAASAGISINSPDQYCAHGTKMKYLGGISSKTGKPFRGYVCECGNGCDAKWAQVTANGHWYLAEDN